MRSHGARACGDREPARRRAQRPRAREPHPVGDRAQDLRDRLHGLQLALLDDRDPPRGLGEPLGDPSDHCYLVSDSITIGRRSSTTAPPSVWMKVVSSSSSRTSWRCVVVVVSTHTVCTRGRSSAASAARSAPERARPARTGASPCCAGDSRSAIAASTSTFSNSVSTDLAATCVGSRRSRSSGARSSRNRLRRGRVFHVEGEHPDEGEQDCDDGQHTRADQAGPRQPPRF